MNKRLLKILEAINKVGEANFYELRILTGYNDSMTYYSDMFYLMKHDYIWFNNGMKHKYSFDKESDSHEIIPFDLSFHLTTDGENILFEHREESRKFKINSILIPIIISVITSFLTAYFTLKLIP